MMMVCGKRNVGLQDIYLPTNLSTMTRKNQREAYFIEMNVLETQSEKKIGNLFGNNPLYFQNANSVALVEMDGDVHLQ